MTQTSSILFAVTVSSPRYDNRDVAHWETSLATGFEFISDEAAGLAAELLAHWYNPEGDLEIEYGVAIEGGHGYWDTHNVQTPRLPEPALEAYGDENEIPF